ncbi:ATP-binding cassette domain-containing protein [Aeromicrobium fastidiosum]|uniref:ATP-binding cassette domain-containing protein n=1 Tax=Aeromicrobium fastidiosum TaxID=52699 RepID=A0A641AL45_9ACTN|nr:ATP-binding cassette domain-containing protein [Aeromicrobium fastidiosum]KAA1376547.1 ATP-binding cassette domain-containing protein [Aeromicrobium fastidiosum]MBP2391533.1 ABC-2 type transport system ATP-binding protein [Aeromicrobium fastidiosum]
MTEWAIRAEGLVKEFGSHRALDGIDLSVRTGTVHAVLGPNGAGKTTAVRVLSTLLRPDAGTAHVFGHDAVRSPTAVRSLIGLTGQYASVDELLTAHENLFVFARLLGLGRRQARSRADELLERFSLTDAAHRSVSTFSGGMRRRLDIAASLLGDPPLLFLDEPTTGLDPRTRADMWTTVRELVAEGSTVLLTTQYLEEADQLADRIAVIDRGRVVADDTSEALKRSVGGLTLQLQIGDRERWPEAMLIVERLTGREPSIVDGRLAVPITSSAVTSGVVLAFHERAIVLDEISVARPTMDDVFFALTGSAGTERQDAA